MSVIWAKNKLFSRYWDWGFTSVKPNLNVCGKCLYSMFPFNCLDEYKIPGWKQFSFRILKALLHDILVSSIALEKSKATLMPDPFKEPPPTPRTSLVAQWLRIHLPTQGTRVQALIQEDSTCHGATKPMHHNYWACALESASRNYWVRVPQLLKPTRLEPVLHNKRSHRNEKPTHCNEE